MIILIKTIGKGMVLLLLGKWVVAILLFVVKTPFIKNFYLFIYHLSFQQKKDRVLKAKKKREKSIKLPHNKEKQQL